MEPIEIIAQAVGILAMAFNILSYQGKRQKTVILLQLFGAGLFAVNYLMLGAAVGGILNLLGTVRSLVFLFKDKLKADRKVWLVGFVLSYVAVYVLNFTVFGKELTVRNCIVELLPVVGMTALTVGFRLKNAADIRKCGLVSSPSWLIYNVTVGSWGAILCEIFTLISIFVGMFRHDKASARN